MPFIFIDESGQFTKRNRDNYFLIASFTIGNQRRTEKQFRSWQRTRFPRRMRNQAEIKFSDINVDDKLRLRTIKHIANLDVRINYAFFKKDNIHYKYWRKNRLESGILYTNVVGEVLEMYLPANENNFRVFCDKRHLKGIKRSKFKNILEARLLPDLPYNPIVQIEMIDSTTNANIQIADWIAGSLAHYKEEKPLGKEFYRILKNNIIGEKELFK